MKKVFNILIALLVTTTAWGQTETESLFRQSGKIYVVVAILSVIFLGIIIYLVALDRRINRLEKQKKER